MFSRTFRNQTSSAIVISLPTAIPADSESVIWKRRISEVGNQLFCICSSSVTTYYNNETLTGSSAAAAAAAYNVRDCTACGIDAFVGLPRRTKKKQKENNPKKPRVTICLRIMFLTAIHSLVRSCVPERRPSDPSSAAVSFKRL